MRINQKKLIEQKEKMKQHQNEIKMNKLKLTHNVPHKKMSITIYLNQSRTHQIDTIIIIRLLLNKHLKTNKLIPVVIDTLR